MAAADGFFVGVGAAALAGFLTDLGGADGLAALVFGSVLVAATLTAFFATGFAAVFAAGFAAGFATGLADGLPTG